MSLLHCRNEHPSGGFNFIAITNVTAPVTVISSEWPGQCNNRWWMPAAAGKIVQRLEGRQEECRIGCGGYSGEAMGLGGGQIRHWRGLVLAVVLATL